MTMVAAFAMLGVLACLVAAPNHRDGNAGEGPLEGYGVWTVSDLGGETISWSGTDRSVQVASYEMPVGARQGEGAWTRLRLHFAVDIVSQGPGVGYLTVTEGDVGIGSVRFLSYWNSKSQVVHWDTVDVQNGTLRYATLGSRIHGYYETFLPLASAAEGVHVLKSHLQEYGGLRLTRAIIFDDTVVVRDNRGPPKLAVSADGFSVIDPAADLYALDVVVRNSGDFAARNVVVEAEAVGDMVAVRGDTFAAIPWLVDEKRISFQIAGAEVDDATVVVEARGDSGGVAVLRMPLRDAREREPGGIPESDSAAGQPPLAMRLAAGVLAAVCVLALTRKWWFLGESR
jgi:hypothetical protein